MSAEELWEHIASLDSTVLVGLKQPGERRGIDEKGRVLVPKHLRTPLAHKVKALGVELRYIDDFHPLVNLRLTGPSQIEALRRLPVVEYVEPASFDPSTVLMDFGCGASTPELLGSAQSPGDIVPQTLVRHLVPEAWQVSTGAGVTVGVVDTGTSVYQPQLNQYFNSGSSSGRTITYAYSDANTLNGPPPWHDSCGHGTRSIGLVAAPRDGRSIVGTAYKANIFAVRALDDVAAGPGQWSEVREGIRQAAVASKIVNMAFGWTNGNSDVRSTIRFYYNDPGYKRVFFAAAGTSTQLLTGVIFPADMPEVVAVTGLDQTGTKPCSDCNYGTKVEFSAYTRGETTGPSENQIDGFGGSSAATAVLSGITALVWSKYPSMSRESVVERLRQSSTRRSSRDSRIGYGAPSALCAVGGFCDTGISGPSSVVFNQASRFVATTRVLDTAASDRFQYLWSNGSRSQTTDYITTACPGETDYINVRITDTSTGIARTERRPVTVQDDGSGGNGGLCYSSGF